jgi:hypothetical protein
MVHKVVSLKDEDYWKGEWKVGSVILAGTDLDWTTGRGTIIEIDKENPDWAKVRLEESGKIVDAHKYGSYRYLKKEEIE